MTKDADLILNSWRDLLKNPTQWRDHRENKLNGSMTIFLPMMVLGRNWWKILKSGGTTDQIRKYRQFVLMIQIRSIKNLPTLNTRIQVKFYGSTAQQRGHFPSCLF